MPPPVRGTVPTATKHGQKDTRENTENRNDKHDGGDYPAELKAFLRHYVSERQSAAEQVQNLQARLHDSHVQCSAVEMQLAEAQHQLSELAAQRDAQIPQFLRWLMESTHWLERSSLFDGKMQFVPIVLRRLTSTSDSTLTETARHALHKAFCSSCRLLVTARHPHTACWQTHEQARKHAIDTETSVRPHLATIGMNILVNGCYISLERFLYGHWQQSVTLTMPCGTMIFTNGAPFIFVRHVESCSVCPRVLKLLSMHKHEEASEACGADAPIPVTASALAPTAMATATATASSSGVALGPLPTPEQGPTQTEVGAAATTCSTSIHPAFGAGTMATSAEVAHSDCCYVPGLLSPMSTTVSTNASLSMPRRKRFRAMATAGDAPPAPLPPLSAQTTGVRPPSPPLRL